MIIYHGAWHEIYEQMDFKNTHHGQPASHSHMSNIRRILSEQTSLQGAGHNRPQTYANYCLALIQSEPLFTRAF
jgi:hypothetical protein